MSLYNSTNTPSYTTSTTNMYNKDRFHALEAALRIAATQRYRPKTPGFYRCVLYADQIKGCQRLKKKDHCSLTKEEHVGKRKGVRKIIKKIARKK